MTPADRAARASSFAGTAARYELGRPGYPADLIASLFADVGVDRPRILDLGAGTGKLTRQLLSYGPVTAVEPLDEMRAELERVVPGATSLAGNAESIPAADASFDVVFVGQAYHWFDQDVANPEVARVLVDGGHLVMLWNNEKPVPWIVQLTEIMSRGEPARNWGEQSWWVDRFRTAPWFTTLVERQGAMTVPTTKEGLLARMESHSYLSVRPPAERAPILAEVAELVASFDDPFSVEYTTEAYWCRKLPLPAS